MLDVKIRVGTSEVFATGNLIIQNDAVIRLEPFGLASTYFLEIRFSFSGMPTPSFRGVNEGLGHVVFVDSLNLLPAAVSNTAPMYIANHNGRKVLALFAIEPLGSLPVTRSFAYTLFDGGPVV